MNEKDLKLFDSTPIFHIEVEKIKPNPFQPRRDFNQESLKELSESIREFGILQPLVVSKIEKETPTGADVEYQLIAGERRLMAAKLIGWERVPVIVRQVDEKKERLELAIIENVQRSDLNPLETARAYARLQEEFRLTQREVAQRIGKSRETVANTLRLLDLPAFIQEALSQNKISESHARALLAVADAAQQTNLFNELVKSNLSVRELRRKIADAAGVQPAGDVDSEIDRIKADPESELLSVRLEEALGTRVKVRKIGERGKIMIKFYSREELENILSKIIRSSDNPLREPL
ncbi:MAG: ParB/RepB/Spo0J family partition protein [Patescibacteria group bacterium]